ncbi:PKD domain-containing protein [Terrimonas alba]|uniref:PKD domain-containing protein n=1 Tax=Terrimonas alba TaxID=3349636 RepID=UPI0035F2A734
MKRLLLILATFFLSKISWAEHITGGEMYYSFTGMTADGLYRYHVTLKLYRDCFSAGAQLDDNAAIGIFNRTTNTLVYNQRIPKAKTERLQLKTPGPCITNAPTVCYEVGYYEFDISLPASERGYTIAYQRCCRINGISNLTSSGGQGATYTADIPGTNVVVDAPKNNSAKFIGEDTVIVCGGYPFTYSFAAVDEDPSDVLRYEFCNAYLGGGQTGNDGGPNTPAPNPPVGPPYSSVRYSFPFSSTAPLGQSVTIDPNTGLISGKSPVEGIYVVTVCVSEIRDGKVIAVQRKDLQIKAGGCDIAKAQLNPEYISCDGFTLTFNNLSSSPMINSYYWEFGDPGSGAANNSSTLKTPTHTYSTAGDYTIKLVTNRNQECSDSTTAIVRVWPGFFPAFNSDGICLTNPVLFTDRTTTNYGVVDKWNWNFGDNTTNADTSTTKNPNWTFADTGTKNVQLIVGNSKGCLDTLIKTMRVITKPPITLAFRDTLICVPDNLQLQASGTGVFSWTPATSMINSNTATPTVNPTTTTTYTVELNEQGCINTDTVRVRVVRFVTLNPMPDTVICRTDSVKLNVMSDGLQYQWTSTPASGISDPTTQNPTVLPVTASTSYEVLARIGSCSETANIIVRTVPYPVANAGPDSIICYNTPAYLHGSHDGTSFTWSPVNSLSNPNSLNPIAYPFGTTAYILSSHDNKGCPKPGYDTVLINVLPKIVPFAGNDTMVVIGQPLQLNAEGGARYLWSPSTGLNSNSIKNPVATYEQVDTIRYTVEVFNEAGCSDSAFVTVKIFKTIPYVFVPTAFTPNGDGLNDVIRPIAVGVQQIKYFRIFNRWGQMIFSTTTNEQGWDGKISGVLQGSNVFVWMVSAIDYLGKPIFLKGTVTLIR